MVFSAESQGFRPPETLSSPAPSSLIDSLRASPAFKGVDEESLQHLASLGEEKSVSAGEVVFHQGDSGQELYLVMSGRLVAYLEDKSTGHERELRHLEPGDVFGEIASVTGDTRTASVRGVVPSRIAIFKRQLIMDEAGRNPEFFLTLSRRFARYIVSSDARRRPSISKNLSRP